MPLLRPRVRLASSTSLVRAAVATSPPDNYVQQLVKYIPAESIATYQAIAGLVTDSRATGSPNPTLLWIGAVILIGTPLWTFLATKSSDQKPAWYQVVVSFLAFAIWLGAVDNPLAHILFPGWTTTDGSIALILATGFVFPLLSMATAKIAPNLQP